MRAFIFGALQAKVEDAIFYNRLIFAENSIIICAYCGYNIAMLTGIKPDVVIGDMDSLKGAIPQDIKTIIHPKAKDKTDMHLCIDYALENGFNEIVLLNAFGGRIDHSISALISLNYIMENGGEGMLVTKHSKVFLINRSATVKRNIYSKISLIPLTETVKGVTTNGLQYPLKEATLYQSANLGISNAFCSNEATIDIKEGVLGIICEAD